MLSLKSIAFLSLALFAGYFALGETAVAACGATVNGRPMTPAECALNLQIYGRVVPGRYLVDANGNWVNVDYPRLRGNIYNDARSGPRSRRGNYGGSWGGGSIVSPRGVYDGSGGCEGGRCVNILD